MFSDTIDGPDAFLVGLEHPPFRDIREALLKPAAQSSVPDASYSQPLCTAVRIRLVKTLQAWGVSPSAVVGHSCGEIAATFAVGLLNEAQAIAVAYYWNCPVRHMEKHGAMLAGRYGTLMTNVLAEL